MARYSGNATVTALPQVVDLTAVLAAFERTGGDAASREATYSFTAPSTRTYIRSPGSP